MIKLGHFYIIFLFMSCFIQIIIHNIMYYTIGISANFYRIRAISPLKKNSLVLGPVTFNW